MKTLFLSMLAVFGLGFTLLGPQQLFDRQSAALKDAKALKVTYSLQHVPGTPAPYTLTYSKPDLLLIDGPERTIESDGKTLWEYTKSTKSYNETPASAEAIAKRAQADETLAWAWFFANDLAKGVSALGGGTTRIVKGNPVTELTFTLGTAAPRTLTLYIDDKLGIARGMSLKSSAGDLLAMASTIEVSNDPISADKFVFQAPAGAAKVEAPKPDSLGWATVQPIFASNCTPCHAGRGKAGFSISSYESVMKGPDDGPVITPGDENSRLIRMVTGQTTPKMPPMRNVSDADVETLKAWIKAGAKP